MKLDDPIQETLHPQLYVLLTQKKLMNNLHFDNPSIAHEQNKVKTQNTQVFVFEITLYMCESGADFVLLVSCEVYRWVLRMLDSEYGVASGLVVATVVKGGVGQW